MGRLFIARCGNVGLYLVNLKIVESIGFSAIA